MIMKAIKAIKEMEANIAARCAVMAIRARDEKGMNLVELCIILGVSCLLINVIVKPNLRTGITSWAQNVVTWLQDTAHV